MIKPGRSPQLLAAFRAEFRAGRNFRGTFRTLRLHGQFKAAFGAELRAVSFGVALRTDQLPVAFHVHLFAALDALQRGFFACGIDFPGGPRGFNLHLGIRRAGAAQSFVPIPAEGPTRDGLKNRGGDSLSPGSAP